MSAALTIPDLAVAVAEWRREGAVIVLASGCFDPVHAGHVQHLRTARSLGNVLIVAVTGDAHVNKGPGRPRCPDWQRAEVLAGLRDVDAVTINNAPDTSAIIYAIRPHIFVKGVEYRLNRTPQIVAECEAVSGYGGRVEYVTGQVVLSSTAILAGSVR